MVRGKYRSKATFCTKNYQNLMTELGERSIWIFESCILHVFHWFLYSNLWFLYTDHSKVTIEKSTKNMQNATFKNSNRSFSELRHQILIIFGAKCSFTPVLSTYQLLSKSYDWQKRYFEKKCLSLNRFEQNCGFSRADFDTKPRFC